MNAVRTGEERRERADARIVFGAGDAIARPHRPRQTLDLVLPGFDDQPNEVVRIRQRAQLGKTRAFVGARPGDEVVARGKIELAARDVGRRAWHRRVQRPEPGAGVAADDIAKGTRRAGDDAFGDRRRGGLSVGHWYCIPSTTGAPPHPAWAKARRRLANPKQPLPLSRGRGKGEGMA